MPHAWRFFRPVLLVLLLLSLAIPLAPGASYAQEGANPVVIQGSQQLEQLVTALRDAYQGTAPDAQITVDPQGPNRGFDALCNGEADIVMSTEPISDTQVSTCTSKGTNFIETVIAYEAVVLVATPEAGLTCVSQDQINTAWSLGAPASVSWADLGSTTLDSPISFYGPASFSPAYQFFSGLVPAGELREDIVTTEDPAQIIARVQETQSSALGFLSLADFETQAAGSNLTPLQIQQADGTCVTPALSTVEDRSYPYSRPAYLYLSETSTARPEVQAFMQFALTDPAGTTVVAAAQGYSVPDEATRQYGWNNVQNNNIGRTFSRPASPVQVSTAETGTVTVAGTTLLSDVTKPITTEFTTRFPGTTLVTNTLGNDAGWQAFCSGQADLLQTTRDATADEQALCDSNGITAYTLDLGYEALVLAVPESLEGVDCVNAAQVSKLLGAGTDAAPAPKKWSDVSADWPDKDVLLVLPPRSTGETDYLLYVLRGAQTLNMREDVTENRDPLYRAQGVANTDNGFTYFKWSAFQGSTAKVKLLGVDAGQGCVTPSPETFADGTYPLAYPVRYLFSEKSFSNPLLRALLWHFFDPTSIQSLGKTPFAGLDLAALSGDLKNQVFDMLAEYEATVAPAATEEPPAATETAPTATEAAPAATEAAPAVTESAPAATEAAPAATEAAPAATESAQ